MTKPYAARSAKAIPLHIITEGKNADGPTLTQAQKEWAEAMGFSGKLGQILPFPDSTGGIDFVLAGLGNEAARKRGRLWMARIAQNLPKGVYEFASGLEHSAVEHAALSWGLAHYAFERYRKQPKAQARLKLPKGVSAKALENIIYADFLARDLINTPTEDMGPEQLEKIVRKLAKQFDAKISVTKGQGLLRKKLNLIHTVGRAAEQEPRLIDMTWGRANWPKITLVGKGVCFDTGGLNLKPGNSMGLMKKDMGGAANVLALARMIMGSGLKVRLRVLIPAVENSVAGNSFRPGDILTSRKGLTVEINNTDAEGRLVLADALSLADDEKPELLICKATLTGAARVALGADLMPFYCDDNDLADGLISASGAVEDPLWRMPFWPAYESKIEPGIADLDNAPAGGFAGSITAALFLKRFAEQAKSFVHFDIYGWSPSQQPGRSKGGACQSPRAVFDYLTKRYG